MISSFKDFNLAPEIQKALDSLGFTQPTEIQQKAIPLLLGSQPIDIHGQAQTGTGKTFAFGIPLLQKIDPTDKTTQALVVAPTRELAVQICDSLRPLAQARSISIDAIYGGVSMEDQIRSLKKGVQLVVGTPGRLNDHLRRKTLSINNIKTLVLDEADIMLDMGFKDEIDEILSHAPKKREIWLFSATVKPGINNIMRDHMHEPISVRISKKNVGTTVTKQYYCMIPMRQRLNALARFIESAPEFYGFIFCQTKILTSEIAEQLLRRGYLVGALHGDMSQAQRNAVIKKFKQRELSIVVATDVAARGIDIANLTHVINYSLPEDLESYVHRVGRTGRAGKEGIAITFITKSDSKMISLLERKFNISIQPIAVPSREEIIKGRLKQASLYLQAFIATPQEINPEVTSLLDGYDDQALHTILAKILEEKFLSSILIEEDMPFATASRSSFVDNGMQELFINVGSDDEIDREDVINFLTSVGGLDPSQIGKIRIIKRRTFFDA
ncbi:MAG TPA: DEAD/DEAH box helicase, partial [Candidatus Babeliaceae bacterium]|nr:DEAD/DEAH box helicase [Candidatus Babeliaceae bacterium]